MSEENSSEADEPNGWLTENCDDCGNDYEIRKDKDTLIIFLLSPSCNHIEAICPHCAHETDIFIEAEVVLYVLSQARLCIKLAVQASENFQRLADEYYGELPDSELPTPPIPDRELTGREFRELGDDIRAFERGEQ